MTENEEKSLAAIHKLWKDIMHSCYMTGEANKDVVAKEWREYANFEKWVLKQNVDIKTMVLSKDVLQDNCNIYSKDTCCFVTKDVLQHIARLEAKTSQGLPSGIKKLVGKRRWNVVFIHNTRRYEEHYFKTLEEALQCRKKLLWDITLDVAEKQTDVRAVLALIQRFSY